jgi:hypothetical protein
MNLRPLILLSLSLSLTLLAAESPATGIAASVIRERAREAEQRGQLMIGQQLRALADSLSTGAVNLQDATLIVHMALAGSAASPLPTRSTQPAVSAKQVTAILDGESLPPSKPIPEPIVAPNSTIAEHPTSTLIADISPLPVVTSVLTASLVGEPKSLLVMIGAGEDQQIKIGQRFIVKRNDEQIAVISATQVKASMSICIAIPGTVAEGGEIRAGDSVLSE